MASSSITDRIKSKAHQIGFDLVGITRAEPHEDIAVFDDWIQKNLNGTMDYLARRRDERSDPKRLMPSAKTIIICGLNYYNGERGSQDLKRPAHAWISRYAWGDDYHEIVLNKLKELEDFIRTEIDESANLKSFVDTGPLLEKSYAARAGLGWIGKNTLLINEDIGSFTFIGEILCSLDMETDKPQTDQCAGCQLCIDACPTKALNDYQLDATRCISYWTIEQRGEIPKELQQNIGHHLFGCDICQEVCPWNHAIPLTNESSFGPRNGLFHPSLDDLSRIDAQSFQKTFKHSPIKRCNWEGLKRNLDIVKDNQENS
jgi:epoxyqueuosine reductase